MAAMELEPPRQKACWEAAIDSVIAPEEDECDAIFLTAQREGAEIFFQHLTIRNNGGLRKTSADARLFTPVRVAQVVMTFGFVGFNVYTVIHGLVSVLQNSSPEAIQENFLLLINRESPYAAREYWVLRLLTSLFEVGAMFAMLSYSLYVVTKFNWFVQEAQLSHYRIWHQLNVVCCLTVPTMTNFSAMRSLQFLNPQTLESAFSLTLAKVEEGYSYCRVITVFAFFRLTFGILGFVAFSVKFSQLVLDLRILLDDQKFTTMEFVHQVVLLFGFVNQVFGITQIWRIEMNRLFLMIFGGEDAQLMCGDVERQDAYLASTMHFICTTLYAKVPAGNSRRLRRAVALLTFNHLDIQSLVVEDDEDLEVTASSIRSGELQRRTLRAERVGSTPPA